MKLACLILAHGQYEHLKRLLTALDDERVHFYIHVDAKSPMPADLSGFADRITFIEPRVKVWWAGWSQVEAELALARAAAADGGYDYYALISGVDYPIRPNEWLFRTLEGAGEFISITPLRELPVHFTKRIARYHFDGFDRRNILSIRRLNMWFVERLLRLVAHKRVVPFGQMYSGSAWWVLSEACVRHVLQMADDERIVRFFRTSFIPDESFVQSIVGNSPFREQVRGNLTYLDWSAGGSGPAMITQAHLGAMAAGEWFFARKFDDAGGELCERIDRTLREEIA